jgi:AAA+ ATPase superfamily predicted ATPase
MKFINRQRELKALNDRWAENKAHLFIFYGKRRVGKTELIKQFIKGKPSIYFLADRRSPIGQLKSLGRVVGEYFSDEILIKNGFSDWLEVFAYLKKKAKDKFIIAIDEYPYLAEAYSPTSSLFQKGWDEYLKDTNIFLILSGSSIAMMESETLIYSSPLFGRRTGQLLIKPLNFNQSWQFFPEKSFEDFLSIYTIAGGMPAYLLRFDKALKFEENIYKNVFDSSSFLFNEIEFFLREELRDPKTYLSILMAIAFGKRKHSEISNYAGLDGSALNKYLTVLINLQLIEKETPITEVRPEKSRKGLYRLSDNFFIFWFQYIFQYRSHLEIGNTDFVLKKMFGGLRRNQSVNSSFKLLEAYIYENVCRELVNDFEKEIGFFDRVGRWWGAEKEIDVVGLNDETKEIIFGECKWSQKPVGTNIYEDLRQKAKFVDWHQNTRKEYFILFSKSGFTDSMRALAKKESVFLVDKNKLVK